MTQIEPTLPGPWSLDPTLERRLRTDGPEVLPTWFLPGPLPKLDEAGGESDEERTAARRRLLGDWVRSRGQALGSAPGLITQYLVILQRCIDRWDHEELRLVLVELLVYVDAMHALLDNAEVGDEGHTSVAELLRLDLGLDLARELRPAEVHANLVGTEELFESSLSDVLHFCRLAWRHGLPQRAALEPLDPVDFDDWRRLRGDLWAGANVLHSTVKNHAVSDPRLIQPLHADLHAQMRRRLLGPGRTLGSIGELHLDRSAPDPEAARAEATQKRDSHIFFEFLAHRYAYSPEVPVYRQGLVANGYEAPYAFESRTGLNFFIVLPTKRLRMFLPPIVVFRGTQPDDLKDIRTDLEFQIGSTHFHAVREIGLEELLQGAAADCYGSLPILIGHSLGGALAQLSAAHWPHLVGKVVTFQSPGLTRANYRRFEEGVANPRPAAPLPVLKSASATRKREANNRFEVTHYIADDDIVHMAGQLHLPGATILATGIHLHRRHEPSWGLGHTHLLLAGHDMGTTLQIMGLAAVWSPHTLSSFALLPEHPTSAGQGHEMVRGGIALLVELVRGYRGGERTFTELKRHAREAVAKGLARDEATLMDGFGAVGRSMLRLLRDFVGQGVRAVRGSAKDREAVGELRDYAEDEIKARVRQGIAAAAEGEIRPRDP